MRKALKQSLTWIQEGFGSGDFTRLDIRQTDDGGLFTLSESRRGTLRLGASGLQSGFRCRPDQECQKTLSGAPEAARWAVMTQLGNHFDIPKTDYGGLGLHLGAPRAQFNAPETHFRRPGRPF